MLSSTIWLTLSTLLGLLAGFAREWLLIDAWGAGSKSDALIVALFLPEALRMTMASGLLGAAALPLFQQRTPTERIEWLAVMVPRMLMAGMLIAAIFALGAPLLVKLIGPGLAAESSALAGKSLSMLAWCAPCFILHGLLAVPLQARSRFVLAGLGSAAFNLPPVIYLVLTRAEATPEGLIHALLLGSLLMPAMLMPALWSSGWRPWISIKSHGAGLELVKRIWPLLASNLASHGLALLERIVASLLGEGSVTWLNLARKLINLPLIALMSLNQVLLSLMSGTQSGERLGWLNRGLSCATMLSLPAAVGLIGSALALVTLLIPGQTNTAPLALLISWFSVPLLLSAWNPLLARYAYADGNTALPLQCELGGNLANACLLAVLPFMMGLPGVALASAAGMLLTTGLLLKRQNLILILPWRSHWLVAALTMTSALLLLPLGSSAWQQLFLSGAIAGLLLIFLALWLHPWRA